MQTAGMMNDEALQKVSIQAIDVTDQLAKVVLLLFQAQIQADMAKLGAVVDEQRLLGVALHQIRREMHGECGSANAPFCAEKRQYLSWNFRLAAGRGRT